MNGMKIDFNNYIADFQKKIDAADKKTRAKAATYAVSEVKKATPKKTGALKKSVKKKHFKRSSIVGFTRPEGSHAHLVEYGHDIVRNKKKVGHVAGTGFFKSTMERIAPTIQKMIKEGFAEI